MVVTFSVHNGKFMEEIQIELADNLAEAHRNFGIEKSRIAMQKQVSADFNGVNCIDCGDTIHEKRLAMQRIRCTDCESDQETRSRLFRH